MTGLSRIFCLRGGTEVEAVVAVLGPRYDVAVGAREVATHTWLDTFDWRLHSAGLSLDFVGDGPLALHFPDGTQLQAPQGKLKWPAHPQALPDGRLRDALTPIVAPRALLPVVAAQCVQQTLEVHNADAKTVARLLIVSVDDTAGLLRIRPLRGYDDDGDRIARSLTGIDGFDPVVTTLYDVALSTASRRPASQSSPLRPGMPAAEALAEMLRQFAAVIEDNVPGTIAATDIEFLHDLRVAVRRTRSILKLVGDVLPNDLAERFAPDFKWLGDLTTPVRDLDVYLAELDTMADRLNASDPADLEPFRSFLVKQRGIERRRLARGLRSKRFDTLISDWRAELDAVAADAEDGITVAALARERLSRAYRTVARRGARISADSPGADVHALRKRCKELRYLLEVFKPVCASSPHRALLKELKSLQDTLGDFQDGEVQREAVREYAGAMMEQGKAPPETVLAMGEMAAQLDARQLSARGALADRLQPFLADKNRARVKALVR